MTTPTGNPIWTRAAGFADYGGNVNKRNHLSQGSIDPETDVSAAELQRLSADLAAMARVAPFAVLEVACNDTPATAAPTINSAYLSTGTRTTSYEGDAAPSGYPSAARVSNGVFTLTFASSYSDDYAVSGSFIVQPGCGNVVGSTSGSVSIVRTSDTVLTVYAYTAAGAALTDAVVSLSVFSGGA